MLNKILIILFTILLLTENIVTAQMPAGDNDSLLLQILKELKEIRSELEFLKKEVRQNQQNIDSKSSKSSRTRPPKFVKASIDDDPVLGDENAPVTIIEFSDYQCPYCKKFYQNTFSKLKTDFIEKGRLKFVMRDFPLPSHKQAKKAASTATCAGKQGKYWEMHDLLFESKIIKNNNDQWERYAEKIGLDQREFKACMKDSKIISEAEKDMQDGKKIGVTGTPGFVIGRTDSNGIIDGELIIGAKSISFFEKKINALLKEK